MVFQKRLDYGFNGYQVPPTPRAPRSVRRRRLYAHTKKVDENQMCAFDLLATLAGKILVEGEKSVGVGRCEIGEGTKKEQSSFDKSMKREPYNSTSYEPTYKSTNNGSEVHNPDPTLKLSPPSVTDSWANFSPPTKIEAARFQSEPLIEPATGKLVKSELPDAVKPAIGADIGIDSFEVPNVVYRDHASFGTSNVKIFSRDDDEKYSGCIQPSTLTKACRSSPPRLVDRRIRKFLAYKYWNVGHKAKDGGGEIRYSGMDKQPIYQNKRCCFRRQRSQRNYPFKKRKMYYNGSFSNSDEFCPNRLAFRSVIGTSSSNMGENAPYKRMDSSHVKLRIKSFRVPELFIEISEMATVGSLKCTVMEAVTSILGDGLRVGVLLNGKKIADDEKTLLQTGISHDNQLDSVGFSLEPNTQNLQSLPSGNSPHMVSSENHQPLTRYIPQDVRRGTSDMLLDHPLINIGNFMESDHDSAPSPDLSVDKFIANSRAIVPVQAVKMEVVPAPTPVNSKSKQSEAVRRRIRRPFSVSEVEALVQAVEKLGTGRWRDVKLQAFENAKHRTYVDLKDKWKTLVHTAKISPQQRRGEPVPQELLDRVLNAHAYWSLQQAKQQLKHQRETRLFLELEPTAASAHNRN